MGLFDEILAQQSGQFDPTEPTLGAAPAGEMTSPGIITQPGYEPIKDPKELAKASRALDLQRLGLLARSLKGLPEEIQAQVLAQSLGIPFKSKAQQAQEQMMGRLLMQHKLTEPYRQEQLKLNKAKLEEQQKYYKQRLHESVKSNLTNSIAKLTSDIANLPVGSQEYMAAQKMLLTQHKLYQQMLQQEAEEAAGGAEQQQQPQNPPQGSGGY